MNAVNDKQHPGFARVKAAVYDWAQETEDSVENVLAFLGRRPTLGLAMQLLGVDGLAERVALMAWLKDCGLPVPRITQREQRIMDDWRDGLCLSSRALSS
ncbi:hypothetical protein ACOJUR_08140 [Alicyclobacillus tolerans]|uniref:Aminoglycoside phosphotransferase n=1 Tax=Alicyclobacillus tolerans TaxID=90970 RepID=A0ABT9LXH4_9BACL|nr:MULTISPECIES: hypothetical protein [Alicyclobacillus]MDP9728964.1 aminoglycoside phosphotransferase [Alicyclobacillus tengchongensis]QRF23615.1 hypothetical protein FY534_07975 [Alicyclobacillus sp. TC]